MSVTQYDYFMNPRTSWEMESEELFDITLSIVSGEVNLSNFFKYFSITYPIGSSNIPRYISKRLAGSYGTANQKINELHNLSKHGINKKEGYEVQDTPTLFSTWPNSFNGEVIIEILPDGKSIEDMISSLESCITRRNNIRNSNGIPTYIVNRGRIVYDEFIMILQILRAKLIMIKNNI